MASSKKTLLCFVLSFCLLNSVFSMPFAPDEEEEENELKFEDAPEEIPEDELLAEKEDAGVADEGGSEKELEKEYEEEDEEKELEAEEKELEETEKDLEEENKEEEIAEKDLEEDKEDEIAEKDMDSADDEAFKNEGSIIFSHEEDEEKIPDEEDFHKDEEEEMESEAGEPVGGFDEEGNEKPGFVHRAFRKIKDFFKGLGK